LKRQEYNIILAQMRPLFARRVSHVFWRWATTRK